MLSKSKHPHTSFNELIKLQSVLWNKHYRRSKYINLNMWRKRGRIIAVMSLVQNKHTNRKILGFRTFWLSITMAINNNFKFTMKRKYNENKPNTRFYVLCGPHQLTNSFSFPKKPRRGSPRNIMAVELNGYNWNRLAPTPTETDAPVHFKPSETRNTTQTFFSVFTASEVFSRLLRWVLDRFSWEKLWDKTIQALGKVIAYEIFLVCYFFSNGHDSL